MTGPHHRLFRKDQTGAITVDWVVLSAAVIGLGMAVLLPVAFATDSTTNGIAEYVGTVEVGFGSN